ncbi:carbon-nitrogen hydrolase [Spectribacter hydrogenoxidans]|uniref:Carbon-nitrogen hydrolase n=1 Tax=Spectribacter hydrogenoxidans TaxID=3075608 RepID=A0ABU3C3G2_9GAMM|nr:carbon-nitrogen hydrolase [Salinisphaera sp. W335]MDT0635884.1 carbon-nitrogen hydrolase [Salinisphaera sp. W335]
MSERILRAGIVQHACQPDAAANLATSLAGIESAAAAGAQLVILPELHNHPYFCRVEDPAQFDLAEPIPGPTTERLAAAARANSIVVVGSLFERRAPGLFHNTAVVLDRDGRLAGRYRKMHIPDDPAFYEKFYFTPGDLGFEPIDTSIGRLGVLVCWDQWYPEAARLMALAGAEVLIYPSAIGWDDRDEPDERARQHGAWQTVQRGHAVANHLPVIASNRVGVEGDGNDRIRFWGASFAVDPQGGLLAEAGDGAETLIVDLPTGRTESLRRMWPFLRDRRIDAYADLTRRYRDG